MAGSTPHDTPAAHDGKPRPEPSLVWLFGLIALIVALDQVTKMAVVRSMRQGETRTLIDGVLSLSHVRNYGAAFGTFSDYPGLLTIGASAGVVIAGIILVRRPPTLIAYGAALVIGGAVGNLIDRAREWPFQGSVVDFIDFTMWPAFNVADMAVTSGVALLLLASFLFTGDDDRDGEPDGDEMANAAEDRHPGEDARSDNRGH